MVICKADEEIERLISERNLRFFIDNLDVGKAKQEEVDKIAILIEDAKNKNVASNYMEHA